MYARYFNKYNYIHKFNYNILSTLLSKEAVLALCLLYRNNFY